MVSENEAEIGIGARSFEGSASLATAGPHRLIGCRGARNALRAALVVNQHREPVCSFTGERTVVLAIVLSATP